MTDSQWDFVYWFFHKFENDKIRSQMLTLDSMLGTTITSEDIAKLNTTERYIGDPEVPQDEKPTTIRVPLLWAMAPQVVKEAKKQLAPGGSLEREPFYTREITKYKRISRRRRAEVEGYEMSKEDFLLVANQMHELAIDKASDLQKRRMKMVGKKKKGGIEIKETNGPPSTLRY